MVRGIWGMKGALIAAYRGKKLLEMVTPSLGQSFIMTERGNTEL